MRAIVAASFTARSRHADTHPAPSDVLLVVEVSDTSSEYDRKMKMPLYARAGIPEVWLINLVEESFEIFAKPANGRYQEIKKAKRSQSISPKKLPAVKLRAAAILG
ncbi:MAG: Uma2 family endonuclease [Acidobacteriota bacterium]